VFLLFQFNELKHILYVFFCFRYVDAENVRVSKNVHEQKRNPVSDEKIPVYGGKDRRPGTDVPRQRQASGADLPGHGVLEGAEGAARLHRGADPDLPRHRLRGTLQEPPGDEDLQPTGSILNPELRYINTDSGI
jgi:hypothetical protein